MSTVLPTVPTLDSFGYIDFPEAQPFSQRAASGYQETLEQLVYYVQRKLVPFLIQSNPQGVWDANVVALVAAVNQTIQDTIDAISQQQISVTDPAILAVLNDGNSAARTWLDTHYGPKLTVDGDNVAAVAARLKKRFAELYISLADFGAVGDGIANDTQAVKNWITAILATTDPIYVEKPVFNGESTVGWVPLGTYNIDEIEIKGSLRMVGAGGGLYAASVFQQRSDGHSIFVLGADTDGQSNASVFEWLTFKSRSASSNPTVAQIKSNPAVAFTSSVYFRNCWFKTPEAYAIWMSRGGDVQIIGCTFDVSAFHGIKLGDNGNPDLKVSAVRIIDNTFFNIAVRAIEVSNAQDVLISLNSYENDSGAYTNSVFMQITGGGLCTRIDCKTNQALNVAWFAEIDATTDLSFIGVDDNTAKVLGGFAKVIGGGVLYASSSKNNKIQSGGGLPHGAFWADQTGINTCDFSGNIFLPDGTTALMYDMADGRVTNNRMGSATSQRVSQNNNFVNPTANGIAA